MGPLNFSSSSPGKLASTHSSLRLQKGSAERLQKGSQPSLHAGGQKCNLQDEKVPVRRGGGGGEAPAAGFCRVRKGASCTSITVGRAGSLRVHLSRRRKVLENSMIWIEPAAEESAEFLGDVEGILPTRTSSLLIIRCFCSCRRALRREWHTGGGGGRAVLQSDLSSLSFPEGLLAALRRVQPKPRQPSESGNLGRGFGCFLQQQPGPPSPPPPGLEFAVQIMQLPERGSDAGCLQRRITWPARSPSPPCHPHL